MPVHVGKPAPSFSLPSSDGGTQTLAALRGSTVIVYFYPRDNTPGCTIEAQEFRDAVPTLQKLGARVFGVSKDSIASHCKFRDKFGLSFPLLTDADGSVLAAYGAWGDKMMYGKPVTGVIRSTVIIDGGGVVRQHWPKVSVKGHVDAVVAAVRSLGSQTTAAATVAKLPGPAKSIVKPTARPVAKIQAATKPAGSVKKPAAKAKKR
jgi:thioredoxin-dependent peroxiredoxin